MARAGIPRASLHARKLASGGFPCIRAKHHCEPPSTSLCQHEPRACDAHRCCTVTASSTATTSGVTAAEELHRGSFTGSQCVIVGGGPAGLAAACALADIGYTNIEVWDRLEQPQPSSASSWGNTDRSYNIGVTARGQRLLRRIGAMDRVLKCSTPLQGRLSWSPQSPSGERSSTSSQVQQTQTYVIQRDRLVAVLYEHLHERHSGAVRVRHEIEASGVTFHYDGTVELGWKSTNGSLRGHVQTAFLIGCDGANSTIQEAMVAQDPRVQRVNLREDPKNTRVFKAVIMDLSRQEERPNTLTYSERSASGRVLECLPTREGKLIGLVLIKADDTEALGLATPDEGRKFLQREFPNLFPLMPDDEIARFVERPAGRLPFFRYVGPKLHCGENAVLLGDAIHTVKPYFGLGVNSAFEDVLLLTERLERFPDDRSQALQDFSQHRAPDAKALVEVSHNADQGLVRFILPLIVDQFFHRAAPWLFETSILRMMQGEFVRFSEARSRKVRDRVLQVVVVATLLICVVKVAIPAILGLISWVNTKFVTA